MRFIVFTSSGLICGISDRFFLQLRNVENEYLKLKKKESVDNTYFKPAQTTILTTPISYKRIIQTPISRDYRISLYCLIPNTIRKICSADSKSSGGRFKAR